MLRIFSEGEQIAYTAGDTFSINITAEDGFDEGSRLIFKVAENESCDSIVNKTVELENGRFDIVLDDSEKERLAIGNYIYKITVVDNNENIVTRKSGELIVKWGA